MNEGEWDNDNFDSLPEERKQQLMKEANALFNSDKSPLDFMVQSNGSIGPSKLFTPENKKWWEFWK